jgi:hypothetical protein
MKTTNKLYRGGKKLVNPNEIISVGQNIKRTLDEIAVKLDAKFKSNIFNPPMVKDLMSLYRDVCTEFLTLSNKLLKSTKA